MKAIKINGAIMKNIIEFLHNSVVVAFFTTLTVAVIYGLALMIWIMIS